MNQQSIAGILEDIYRQLGDYARLMRLDRPIGIWLLLWPTLWALCIAGKGQPSLSNVLIFVSGVILSLAVGS